MARIDDYIESRKIAVEKLRNDSFLDILIRSGFTKADQDRFRISFLNRTYLANFPEFEFLVRSRQDAGGSDTGTDSYPALYGITNRCRSKR